MQWILSNWTWPLVIAGGCLLALWIVWRTKRGRKVILSRKLSPKMIRTAAVLLVFLGGGADDPCADGQQPTRRNAQSDVLTELPVDVNEQFIRTWRRQQAIDAMSESLVRAKRLLSAPDLLNQLDQDDSDRLFKSVAALGPVGDLILSDLQVARTGMSPGPATAEQLMQAIDAMEKAHRFDHWLNAYIWRKTRGIDKTASVEQLADLFARIERHARITDALTRAQFEVKPTRFSPRAWMSKAAPPKGFREEEAKNAAAMLRIAQDSLRQADLLTWRRDSVMRLSLSADSGPATLIRGGDTLAINPGDAFAFGRLDLLQSSAGKRMIINEPEFGWLYIPASTVVSVWSLPACLDRAGTRQLQESIAAALDGDERAARRLELALPLSHHHIRRSIDQSPLAPGAPRLRMLLSLFDDIPASNKKVPDEVRRRGLLNALP